MVRERRSESRRKSERRGNVKREEERGQREDGEREESARISVCVCVLVHAFVRARALVYTDIDARTNY